MRCSFRFHLLQECFSAGKTASKRAKCNLECRCCEWASAQLSICPSISELPLPHISILCIHSQFPSKDESISLLNFSIHTPIAYLGQTTSGFYRRSLNCCATRNCRIFLAVRSRKEESMYNVKLNLSTYNLRSPKLLLKGLQCPIDIVAWNYTALIALEIVC